MSDANMQLDPRDRVALLDAAIIRRLQIPAPEEPALLPALVLPIREGSDRLGAPRIRARFLDTGASWTSSPRMAVAVIALLLALVATVVGSAIRLNLIPNPFDPDAGLRMRGISIDIPDDWIRLTPPDPFGNSGSFTVLIASNRDVEGCSEEDLPLRTPAPQPSVTDGVLTSDADDYIGSYSGREDQVFVCVLGKPMRENEIRVVVSQGFPQEIGVGPIEPFDRTDWYGSRDSSVYTPTLEDGWTEVIDGLPAKLVVSSVGGAAGAEEVRTWGVVNPASGWDTWFVRASIRGPDLAQLRVQADAIARSLIFTRKPPVLDEAERDDALASAIDTLDRETRRWRESELFSCFPRTPGAAPGELRDRLFEYGPDGPLVDPVPVTCTTAVESTIAGLWHATLTVAWEAGVGYPAGEWGWFLDFSTDPTLGAQGSLIDPQTFVAPGSVGELPPPMAGSTPIPVGSVVKVLPPGIDWTTGPMQALSAEPTADWPLEFGDHSSSEIRAGRRAYVVEGPYIHGGTDWYRLAIAHGADHVSDFAWLPAFDGDRPLLEVVDPLCPASDITIKGLTRMIPAERVLCFGNGEVTLGPVIVTRTEPPLGSDPATGTSGWLVIDTPWNLYGPEGPGGLEPPLSVVIDPSLGPNVPTGTPLTVRGHFDDPASSDCVQTSSDTWTRAMSVLQCRELFVITSFEIRGSP